MLGKSIWLPKYLVSSSRYEDLILLRFNLQMLNDINVKNSRDSLRYKYHLKQITNENCILSLKFQSSTSTFYAKTHSETSKHV